MRTFSGIVFLICCFYISSAQTNVYHPFPDSGMVWNMRISGSECSTCYKRSYYISGDTIINTISCHKIEFKEATGISLPPWYSCSYPWTSGTTFYGGALHEDTMLKKVYLFLPGSTIDTLLYDFSLGVGDTIPYGINNDVNNPIMYVDQIDSVLIGSTYRKRFLLNSVMNGIIEGIGSTTGLLEDLFVFECGGYLECVSQNGQTIYPDTLYPCDLMDGVSEFSPELRLNLTIYPNPVSRQFAIECRQYAIQSIQVNNTIGEEIYSSDAHCESCIVDCEFFPPGIYFVKATSGDKLFFEKIIKQ